MNTDEAKSSTLELLHKLKSELPEEFEQAQVVGSWVWLEFNVPPEPKIRGKLKELGFHWNRERQCWQHPCGVNRGRSRHDPKSVYSVKPAADMALNDALPNRDLAKEFKVVALRECPLPDSMLDCDTPDKAADYWRLHITTNPYFDPERECFVVLLLNTRRKVKGHQLVSIGTMDTILMHPREVFRVAIIAAAAAIVLMHNHPSGDPTPSEADVKVTRDLIRAGQLLRIDVLDHIVMGNPNRCSLRELGHFYQ